jgi:hypothetical protein
MAVDGCGLDDPGLRDQLDRYRRLGQRAATVERTGLELVVVFELPVDDGLLEETLAVERGCCSFFSIGYIPDRQRLSIAVPDAARVPALEAIRSALTGR